jgi:hypothetical protein
MNYLKPDYFVEVNTIQNIIFEWMLKVGLLISSGFHSFEYVSVAEYVNMLMKYLGIISWRLNLLLIEQLLFYYIKDTVHGVL